MTTDTKDKVRINVNVNRDDKEQAAKLFNDMGLNLNTAINMFIKQSISEQGLPFQPRVETELDRAIKDVKDGNTTTFDSVADFSNWLGTLDNE